MSVTNRQLTAATAEALRSTSAEVQELTALQRGVERDLAAIDAEIGEAFGVLAATLVPDLGSSSLDRAAALLRQPSLSASASTARRTQEARELQSSLNRLQEQPAWKKREAIENEVSIQRTELMESITPLQTSVDALKVEPLWPELLACRYGTDEYDVPWWSLLYYRHWKHGDLIVEKHGPRLKVEDFRALVAKFIHEQQALGELQANLAKIDERGAAVKKAISDVERTEQLLRTVDERALARTRAGVCEFLQPLQERDLLQLLASDADLLLCAKRVCGLRAKQQYLRQLIAESIVPSLADVRTLDTKLTRDLAKLRRPKNAHRTWTHDDLVRRQIGPRQAKWQKRRAQWSTTRTQIVSFHHYDRWDPVGDILWWDVMTDGELDGDFVPEVRVRGVHHHHHHRSSHQIDVDSRDIS